MKLSAGQKSDDLCARFSLATDRLCDLHQVTASLGGGNMEKIKVITSWLDLTGSLTFAE